MVGSTNLTGYGTEVQYSDMFTYTNRKDVYDAFASVQSRQKYDVPLLDPYVTRAWTNGFGYFFPYPAGAAETDPVIARINALPSDANTNIRVAQFAWYDTRGIWIANALAAKKAAGATVSAVVGESVGTGVKNILTRAGIPMYPGRLHEQEAHPQQADARLLPGRHRSRTPASGPGRTTGPTSRSATRTPRRGRRRPDSYNQYVGFYDGLITAGLPPVVPPPFPRRRPPCSTTPPDQTGRPRPASTATGQQS